MEVASIQFSQFDTLANNKCEIRIREARNALGDRAVLLAHHYQRADVYRHAELTGDSLQLSQQAARTEAEIIVFCGVHFMAEVADILTDPGQIVVLPDLAAGCSLADMASLAKVEHAWRELSQHLDPDKSVMPVTYINSAADLKAFVGNHGGTICTSSNARKVLEWSFSKREKVLFFPDQHLGRYTARSMGVSPDRIFVWQFDKPDGGLTAEEIDKAKVLLWDGFCNVHQMFRPEHIHKFRGKHPDGRVISHPECSYEVCELSDEVGSTSHILNTVHASPTGTHWLVGTELNLVERLAVEMKPHGVTVQFMSPMVCMCSTMARIDPQHLAWCLENLQNGTVVNQISVPDRIAMPAKKSIDTMLGLA